MIPAPEPLLFEHPPATWIDPSNGRRIDEFNLMHEMATRQVVLLGETHTIAEIHRWQLHVATIIRFIRRNVVVGFEMFPRRVQPVLDEWVAGELGSRQFLEKVDWKNVWVTTPSCICRFFIFAGSSASPCWRSIAIGRWLRALAGMGGMPYRKKSATG
jgi:uncharacterized iron-regulated protein